jgi:CBS domain containing-hemolysin-like protein
MRTVELDAPIEQVLGLARRSGLSRFPVAKRGVDDIVGVIHIKQVVSHDRRKRQTIKVGDIMHPITAVPTTINLEPLLNQLRESDDQIALVIDEFGGTDGLVTMEDLIEELVGDVRDEHDHAARQAIVADGEGSWQTSGLLRPDELGHALGITLEHDDDESIDTLAGLVSEQLEKVPEVGDTASFDVTDQTNTPAMLVIRVERMDGRRADRLRIHLVQKDYEEDER